MLFLWLIAAFTGTVTFAIQLFPGRSLAAAVGLTLPADAYTAVQTIGEWCNWYLSMFGDAIKETLLLVIPTLVMVQLLHALYMFIGRRIPIVGNFWK